MSAQTYAIAEASIGDMIVACRQRFWQQPSPLPVLERSPCDLCVWSLSLLAILSIVRQSDDSICASSLINLRPHSKELEV